MSTKKEIKSILIRMTAIVLTFLTVFLSAPTIFANEIYPEAEYITNEKTYMIKNKASGKYLTLPGYFDINPDDTTIESKNNVYQHGAKINDQYSRTVRIVRDSSSGKYYIWSCLFENIGNKYISSDINDNVVLSSTITDSVKWIIQYDESKGGFENIKHIYEVYYQ